MRVIYQNEVAECGYACLAMVLTQLGRATEIHEISALRPISSRGLSMEDLYDVATEFGLSVQAYRFGSNDLEQIKPGSILHMRGAHFVVFEKLGRGYMRIIDPATGRRRIALNIAFTAMSGYLLEFAPMPSLPRIRARSRVPAALKRVRAWVPAWRGTLAKIVFVALATQLALLALPLLGWLMLDRVVGVDDLPLINVLAGTFAGIFMIGAFGRFAQGYLTELVYQWARVNVTEGMLTHLLRKPISYFEKRNISDLFTKFKAQDDINHQAVRAHIALGLDVMVAVLALSIMVLQSPLLAGVSVLAFALYIGVSLALWVNMRDTRTLVAQESTRCDIALIETIRAAPLIKLFSGESRGIGLFMTMFKSCAAATLQEVRLRLRRDAVLQGVRYGQWLLITWLAAGMMVRGSLSIGVFFAFMIYQSLMSERLARSLDTIIARLLLDAPAARVEDIINGEEERYTPLADSQKTSELKTFQSMVMRGVSFRYGISDHPVLTDASIEIRRGDKIVIMGASGSGKSTLFKLLTAAESLQHGEMSLNGILWPDLTVDEIRRHVACMRQGDTLLHGSIGDNVSLFTADPEDKRVYQALEQVGLLADVMRLPMRTRTTISDTVTTLSAGQRQRLLLARALYQPREVLLLDDPTAILDPEAVAGIAELLGKLDRTVVVITHDPVLAGVFECRYRLEDGALLPIMLTPVVAMSNAQD